VEATITAADVASTSANGQNSVPQITGTPTTGSVITWAALNGHSALDVLVTGTFSATAQFETSVDCVTYVARTAKQQGVANTSGIVTGGGTFELDVAGKACARLRDTAYTSGTITAKARATSAPGLTQILNPVPLRGQDGATSMSSSNPLAFSSADGGEVTIGALADGACSTDNGTCTLNAVLKRIAQRETSLITALGTPMQQTGGSVQTTNLPTTVSTGAGATGASSPRVTVAQDSTTVGGSASIPAGENHMGQVGGTTANPTSTLTRPANTTAYAQNNLVASSVTAGSVTVPSVTAARVTAGSAMLRRFRLTTNKTSGWDGTTFTVRFWSVAPTYANGDGGAYSVSTGAANYLGSANVTLSQFGDGATGIGVPTVGTEIAVKLASGSTILWDLQYTGSAALTPASGQTFTLIPEELQD
jgi:hypothetical protein